MANSKKFRFNSNGVCTNPDKEVFYEKNKCVCIFEFAQVNGGWIFGTQFWMLVNTTEAYGVHGDPVWNGSSPMPLKKCRLQCLEEALEFFTDKGRKKYCSGIIAAINEELITINQPIQLNLF